MGDREITTFLYASGEVFRDKYFEKKVLSYWDVLL